MVKRKIENITESAGPSKIGRSASNANSRRKVPIKNAHGDDSDMDDSDIDESEDGEMAKKSGGKFNVSPKQMYDFCKALLDHEQEKKINFANRKGSIPFESLLKGTNIIDEEDIR